MTAPHDAAGLVEAARQVRESFTRDVAAVRQEPSPQAIEGLRLAYMGRKGKIPALLEGLRDVSGDKREAGKAINETRAAIEAELGGLKALATEWLLRQKLEGPAVDVSLPTASSNGSLHPVSLMRQVLLTAFRRLGFTVYDGPEIDFDFYNFSALNFPPHHPARDMQDTFFIATAADAPGSSPDQASQTGKEVLRTHTSNLQIHAMLNEQPPLRIVAPGRVFRCDSDLTHTPMFHQIEGFVVDRDVSIAHLKGTIDHFLKLVYGGDLKTRFRPSFFPFVEPGAEIDLQCVSCRGKGCRICKETGWLEIGGCGMIHPNVFEAVGYDSDRWTGFAFGFGIDRMAMLKYALPDLRQLFEGSREFLGQFPVYP